MPKSPAATAFATVPEILDELRAGRMIVLTDDEDRENEGDLVLPVESVTPESISFMLREAAGYLFVSLTEADCDRLNLHPQSAVNTSVRGTPLMVSVDGHPRHGLTTGVSAFERAKTIRLLIDQSMGPTDFVRPGHINPLRARDGGVLVRIGQTEGSVDLCRLAGLYPAAMGIEIMRADGEMARVPDLVEFCAKHSLKMCSIKQIIEYRLAQSPIIERIGPTQGRTIRTEFGEFTLFAFRSLVDPQPHLALTLGGIGAPDSTGIVPEHSEPTLVRVHRRDLLGDIFSDLDASTTGSSSQVLRASMQRIQEEGRGAIVYLRPQESGDDWRAELQRAFDFDDEDAPTKSVLPEMVEYGTGSQILRALGLSRLRLLTNSSAEYPQLQAFGLEITERIAVPGQ